VNNGTITPNLRPPGYQLKRRGSALFAAVCERDLEGVVAKWKRGRYHSDGQTTSW